MDRASHPWLLATCPAQSSGSPVHDEGDGPRARHGGFIAKDIVGFGPHTVRRRGEASVRQRIAEVSTGLRSPPRGLRRRLRHMSSPPSSISRVLRHDEVLPCLRPGRGHQVDLGEGPAVRDPRNGRRPGHSRANATDGPVSPAPPWALGATGGRTRVDGWRRRRGFPWSRGRFSVGAAPGAGGGVPPTGPSRCRSRSTRSSGGMPCEIRFGSSG